MNCPLCNRQMDTVVRHWALPGCLPYDLAVRRELGICDRRLASCARWFAKRAGARRLATNESDFDYPSDGRKGHISEIAKHNAELASKLQKVSSGLYCSLPVYYRDAKNKLSALDVAEWLCWLGKSRSFGAVADKRRKTGLGVANQSSALGPINTQRNRAPHEFRAAPDNHAEVICHAPAAMNERSNQ